MTDSGSPPSVLLMLGKINGKLDMIVPSIQIINTTLDKHETRLAKLEHSRAWLLGAAAALSALVGLALRII